MSDVGEPMSVERTSSLVEDLVDLEVMRAVDRSQSRYDPEIDLEMYQSHPEARDALRDRGQATRLLGQRAREVMTRRLGLPRNLAGRLREASGWVRFGLLGLSALLGLGASASILREDASRTVPIFGFLILVAVQILLMIPAALLTLSGLFGGRGEREGLSRLGQALSQVGQSMSLSALVTRQAFRWIVNKLSRARSRGEVADPQRDDRIQEVIETLFHRHAKTIGLTLGVTSHLCGAVFSGSVVLFAFTLMSFQELNYRWGTSILDRQVQTQTLKVIYAPLSGVLEAPDAQAIAWLTGELVLNSEDDSAELRKDWSARLLILPLAYVLVPRLIFLIITGWMLRWKLQGMRADPGRDRYVRAVITQIASPPLGDRTRILPSDLDPIDHVLGTWRSDDEIALNDPERSPASSVTGAATLVESSRPTLPQGPAWVFGYEVRPPEARRCWVEAMPEAFQQTKTTDRGTIDGRQARKALLDDLKTTSTETAPGSILVIFDLNRTPDDQVARFLNQLGQATGVTLRAVLTGGSALRQRFHNQADSIGTRVDLWKEMLTKHRVASDQIYEYDFDSFTHRSAYHFGNWLLGLNEERDPMVEPSQLMPSGEPGQSKPIQRDGRFPQAIPIMVDVLRAVELNRVDPYTGLAQIHRQVAELYRIPIPGSDAPRLAPHSFAAMLGQSQERVQQLWEDRDSLPPGIDLNQASRWIAEVDRLQQLTRYLPNRWTGLGGLCGLALGTGGAVAIGLAAPAAALPIVLASASQVGLLGGAAGAALAQWMPGYLRRQKPDIATEFDPESTQPNLSSEPDPDLDQLARSSSLWTLSLELQTNSEPKIAETLAVILNLGEDDPTIESATQAERYLRRLEDRLDEFARTGQLGKGESRDGDDHALLPASAPLALQELRDESFG